MFHPKFGVELMLILYFGLNWVESYFLFVAVQSGWSVGCLRHESPAGAIQSIFSTSLPMFSVKAANPGSEEGKSFRKIFG
jgi:hypothetical protein